MTQLSLRVITHNIRYAARNTLPGEEPWPIRLPRLAAQLRYHAITDTIVCLQEVLFHQLVDILSALNSTPASSQSSQTPWSSETNPASPSQRVPSQELGSQNLRSNPAPVSSYTDWEFVGVGRDDGYKAGEFNPIIYQPKVWRVLEHRTEWLSPRPHERGWDAGSNRLVEIALFQHRKSGQIVVVMNTHLDNQGFVARREAARMLIKFMDKTTAPGILTGDLNSDDQGEAYKLLNGRVGSDVRHLVEKEARYGDETTFTGFQSRDKDKERIDYIFIGGKWTARMYAVLPNRFEDGVYLSDHRAVVADLELKR